MNKVYQRIWSKAKERWIIVDEKVASKGCPSGIVGAITMAAFLSLSGSVFALGPSTLPTGGKIIAGIGSIFSVGRQMTVNQSTDKMIASWETFNIGSKASVTFKQPDEDSVALNKIYDQNPSQILGALSANGNVYLINPSGIVFGEGAQVNVGGLVASSLNMADSDFLTGKYTFLNDGNAGSVINKGNINAANGGVVALLAPKVTNEGTITANGGSVILGAGNQVTLDFTGDGLISYTIDKGAVDALAENKGLIKADGGLVVMTAKAADSLTQAVVNNSGVIEAQTLENKGGRIFLMSDKAAGKTVVSGTLDASAPNGGNGGFIETSGNNVKIANRVKVNTEAPQGTTGTWLIDPYDFTIASSGGDVTGAVLTTALAGSNVTIQTLAGSVVCTGVTCGTGNPAGNGDIFVNDSISWSQNLLTLNAWRNIEINKTLYGSGTAQLALLYGQGAPNGKIGGVASTYTVNAPVNLPPGNNFSTKLGSSGATLNYYVITSLGAQGSTTGTDLQGINGNLSGNYVLGSNINASATKKWNGGAGFTPIGNNSTRFTGQFDGLGHTISSLTINRPTEDDIGMFGHTNGGDIRNVGLVGGSVNGGDYVGGLAGSNNNTNITNCYTTGAVKGAGHNIGGLVGYNSYGDITNSHATGKVSGDSHVGGLIGRFNDGNITNSYATGAVSGTYGFLGGLIGSNSYGNVKDSFATGKVTGGKNDTNLGGLVGNNSNSDITTSYATGKVSGGYYTGGLVGYLESSTVSNSYATGQITGTSYVGGLVGENVTSTLSNTYATGKVMGVNYSVGGLIGQNDKSKVSSSYATGKVTGHNNYVGGLVGYNGISTVSNSYATGKVTGAYYQIGGLVGANDGGTISNSYAIGKVKGNSYVGGLVGGNGGTITNSHWDTTTSGTVIGVGTGDGSGATGLTDIEMKHMSNFTGWDINNSGSTSTTWGILEGFTYPFLTGH